MKRLCSKSFSTREWDALNGTVESVVNDAFEVADPDAPVGLFNHIFNQGKVVVVWERGEVRGFDHPNRRDRFLAHRRRAE